MITAKAVLDGHGCLKNINVLGHAGYGKKGNDIVCSAVTILVRTGGKMLKEQFEDFCSITSNKKGDLLLCISNIPENELDTAKTVTEFMLRGLSDLEKEFPAHIKINITSNEE